MKYIIIFSVSVVSHTVGQLVHEANYPQQYISITKEEEEQVKACVYKIRGAPPSTVIGYCGLDRFKRG